MEGWTYADGKLRDYVCVPFLSNCQIRFDKCKAEVTFCSEAGVERKTDVEVPIVEGWARVIGVSHFSDATSLVIPEDGGAASSSAGAGDRSSTSSSSSQSSNGLDSMGGGDFLDEAVSNDTYHMISRPSSDALHCLLPIGITVRRFHCSAVKFSAIQGKDMSKKIRVQLLDGDYSSEWSFDKIRFSAMKNPQQEGMKLAVANYLQIDV
jgi:hypothetical protein